MEYIELDPDNSWILKTNKPAYISGETLRIYGTIQHISGQTGIQNINIQLYNPSGELSRSVFVPASSGSFSYSVKLGSDDPSGIYTIKSIPEGRTQESKTTITHSADKLGDIDIKMSELIHSNFYTRIVTPIRDNITITWVNDDSEFHTATSIKTSDGTPDNLFDTGFIPPGKTSTITIGGTENKETYYFCKLHPSEIALLRPEGSNYRFDFGMIESFNILHQKIAESERGKLNFLLRHFSADKIDSINYEQVTRIENRLLTIVFWDIVSFSTLAKNLQANPDLLLGFLRDYFDTATKIIYRHGGCLDKFIGDGIMAIFGLQHKEIDGSQPAKDAVRAALEFRKVFDGIKFRWSEKWKKSVLEIDDTRLGLKTGIHTGKAISGNVGDAKNPLLTAIGHTVNFANRLCDNLPEGSGRIFVSPTTKNNIESIFNVTSIGKHNIHNIGTYEVFEVKGITEASDNVRPLELGRGEITKFEMPNEIVLEQPSKVSAEFSGSVDFGFLTLCITDSLGSQNWFGDPKSCDLGIDTGKLHLKNQRYSSEWDCMPASSILKVGKCRATMAVYEDTNRLAFNRRLVAASDKEVELKPLSE